jgi:hypothetical protein
MRLWFDFQSVPVLVTCTRLLGRMAHIGIYYCNYALVIFSDDDAY